MTSVAPPPAADRSGGLRAALAEVWREVLNQERVADDANLFLQLGATSIHAVLGATRISDRINFVVSPDALLAHPSIAAQVEWLSREMDSTELPRVIPLAVGTAPPPVFFFPPQGPQAFPYLEIAKRVRPDLAIFGLQGGVVAADGSLNDVAGIVAFHVETILQEQPAGPYSLAGQSFGGMLAIEAARVLERQGHRVERLLLIDPAMAMPPVKQVIARRLAALVPFVVRRPNLGRWLPVLGNLVREERTLYRFMTALDPALRSADELRVVLRFALAGRWERYGLDAAAIERATDRQAMWEYIYPAVQRIIDEDGKGHVRFPAVGAEPAWDLIRAFVHTAHLMLRYRPTGPFTSGARLLIVPEGAESYHAWKELLGGPDVRAFPIRGFDGFPAHACIMEAPNVELYASTVDAFLAAPPPR